MIYTMMPFSPEMNLGRAYNEAMALLPNDDDWAVFLDHDAIWTTRIWYRQIAEAVALLPDAGIFTAVQSRGWQAWQAGPNPGSHDMAWHRQHGAERARKWRTLLDVTANSGIAGVVIATSKRSWRKVGGFVDGMYCVDHGYHFACARAGLRVYVIEGLYVYHWRRANGDAPPTSAPTAKNCPCLEIRRREKPPKTRLTLIGPAPGEALLIPAPPPAPAPLRGKRIEAVWYENDTHQFGPLAAVLESSARRLCPDWEIRVRRLERTNQLSRVLGESASMNTQKLEEWNRLTAEARDGDLLALLDADTFLTRPLDGLEDLSFDVALTEKTPGRGPYPINAGVVFLRVGPAARAFMAAWAEVNREMFNKPALLEPWRKRYGGMNQAALGKVLEERLPPGIKVLRLPCAEWNCEDTSWAQFNPGRTRIVHVKSALRSAVFNMDGAFGPVPPLLQLWRAEKRALTSADERPSQP